LSTQDAGGGLHFRAAGRPQAQGRPRRMDRGDAGEEARARRRGGARQQAGQDRLGDDVDRRELPQGIVLQGLSKEAAKQRIRPSTSLASAKDVMIDTVATESRGQPASRHEPELAAMIGTKAVGYHQGQRHTAASTGRTYDRS